MRDKSYDDFMIEHFRANPDYAASLVNSIIEDGDDQGELKLILQDIAAAGLKISFAPVAPKPTPRKRANASKAKPTPMKRAKPSAIKRTTRHPARRRTSAAMA